MARKEVATDSASQPEVKYKKELIMQVAEQKFGLTRTEAIAAFFDAPADLTVDEAEKLVQKFKEKKVK